MTDFNIDEYTDDELKAIAKQIETELVARKDRARQDVAKQIRDLAATIGMTPDEVLATEAKPKPRKRAPVAPKYEDPDTGATWSGRGRAPAWMEARLKTGKTKEDFLIKS